MEDLWACMSSWCSWANTNEGRLVRITEGDDYSNTYSRVGWIGKIIEIGAVMKDNSAYVIIRITDYFGDNSNNDLYDTAGVNSDYLEFI
jgi:hypothetical protein